VAAAADATTMFGFCFTSQLLVIYIHHNMVESNLKKNK